MLPGVAAFSIAIHSAALTGVVDCDAAGVGTGVGVETATGVGVGVGVGVGDDTGAGPEVEVALPLACPEGVSFGAATANVAEEAA